MENKEKQTQPTEQKMQQKNLRTTRRKVRVGVVVSDKMDKTITVLVTRRMKHPKYGKFISRRKKYMVHDENNQARVGDTVRIMETRPLSRHKRWRLVEIIERAK